MDHHNVHPFEVLIVDDEPGDVELIKMALAEGRFLCNVSVAVNGEAAMEFLRQSCHGTTPTPDIVLLDLNMPRKGGKEVLKEMKADGSLAAIPVVVLTTSDVERDVIASYQLGAAGYITKPVDADSLFAIVRGVKDYWFGVVRIPA